MKMSSIEVIRNYKHDIAGKFKDISTVLNALNETSFDDLDNNEIFHAVHEVILKMVMTSRETMVENLNQDIVLIVYDKEPDLSLSKLQIQGVSVRYEIKRERVNYYYSQIENAGSVEVDCEMLKLVLPIKSIEFQKSDL
jgi:hypothetical protein